MIIPAATGKARGFAGVPRGRSGSVCPDSMTVYEGYGALLEPRHGRGALLAIPAGGVWPDVPAVGKRAGPGQPSAAPSGTIPAQTRLVGSDDRVEAG